MQSKACGCEGRVAQAMSKARGSCCAIQGCALGVDTGCCWTVMAPAKSSLLLVAAPDCARSASCMHAGRALRDPGGWSCELQGSVALTGHQHGELIGVEACGVVRPAILLELQHGFNQDMSCAVLDMQTVGCKPACTAPPLPACSAACGACTWHCIYTHQTRATVWYESWRCHDLPSRKHMLHGGAWDGADLCRWPYLAVLNLDERGHLLRCDFRQARCGVPGGVRAREGPPRHLDCAICQYAISPIPRPIQAGAAAAAGCVGHGSALLVLLSDHHRRHNCGDCHQQQ